MRVKDPVLDLTQLAAVESSLKMMQNTFYFMLKALLGILNNISRVKATRQWNLVSCLICVHNQIKFHNFISPSNTRKTLNWTLQSKLMDHDVSKIG